MKKLCDRIMWMHYGSLKMIGEKEEVANFYNEFVKWYNDQSDSFKKTYQTEMKIKQKFPPDKMGK
ncbi:teichoic acids export protein ATP-binding subunit [Listeria fleischmannii subsp. fleischmannii]|uniref:Teichoic acids export protein ATP-binding subunit n=1 Tax=Listeria fleischmannii subsp. fleischmannii TaxID=1671902 RepID=A0A2X3GS64_9LIST|nr:teichoic acids export protein ATP-binding subunit [Listeria fleischmannii subsp. fleischmannii]